MVLFVSTAAASIVLYWATVIAAQFLLQISYYLCQLFAKSISFQVVPTHCRWFQVVPVSSNLFQVVPARSLFQYVRTILATAIVTKSIILDVCRWNHLEQNGTSNQLTQKKTLIGQYCMYNIINLKNITLQIPIATRRSILHVGKVSHIRLCFKEITSIYN